MSTTLYLVNHAVGLLPPTRCFGLKAALFRLAGIKIRPGVCLVSSARIAGSLDLSIGEQTYVGHDVYIGGGKCIVKIGRDVDIAPRVCIVAGTHEIDMVGAHSAGAGLSRDIIIEDGVWIGANATILGGVTIGRKSIIGAGSVVNKSIPPYVIAAGNPCRPIKRWNPQAEDWEPVAGELERTHV